MAVLEGSNSLTIFWVVRSHCVSLLSTLATKNDLLILKSDVAVQTSELAAKIDAAKPQGVTLILSGVGAMLAVVTVLLKVL